jgi:hypothetical protein
MNLFPRLRQSCREERPGVADANGARLDQPALAGAAGALEGQDSRLALNRLFLSGVLAADPQRDRGRDGEPVTLLLVAFPAPDASDTERFPVASCEVEVPDGASGRQAGKLRSGEAIFITGQLSGGGGVIATEVRSGPPPGLEEKE